MAATSSVAPTGRPASSGKGVGQEKKETEEGSGEEKRMLGARSATTSFLESSTVQGLKLPFVVTFASSYDEGYEPTQLEQGGAAAAAAAKNGGADETKQTTPHIKGWQSAKYCPYPQTLVLKFPGYFDIRKIQILSHQAKIANTIEIYAGVSPSIVDQDDSQATYSRLGYLSLDSNERSGFKARELKSVYVNARGNFLKLTIKKCYANQINQYNQVGIIAINVVGTKSLGDPHGPPLMAAAGEPPAASASSSSSTSAPNPNSAVASNSNVIASLVAQYQCDEKTAAKIFDLEKAKSRAIAAEDYDEAKRLKVQLDSLKELGSRLAMLEKQKVQAVAQEDYDLAKQLKKEIDYLRGNASSAVAAQKRAPPQPAYQGHNSQQSLSRVSSQKAVGHANNNSGPSSQRGGYDEYDQPHQHHPHHPPHDQYDSPRQQQHQQPHYQDSHQHQSHAPPSQPRYPPQHDLPDEEEEQGQSQLPPPPVEDDYAGDPEDRPIRPSRKAVSAMPEDDGSNPAPRQAAQPVASAYDIDEDADAGNDYQNSAPAPEPLSAVNRKDAEPLFDVFGDHTVMCLYSKHWILRQQAIKDITQSVLENSSDLSPKELFAASCRVLKRGLGDNVSQVFLSSCQFLQVLLKHLAMKLKPEDVKLNLDPIVGAMMEKLSSSSVRERDGGMQVLTFLAFDSHVHPSLVPSNLLQPLKKKDKDSPMPLKTRAKILLKCVINYGLEDSFALSLGALTKFIVPHLLHRDAGVREGMVNLLAGISSIIGVHKLMPHLKDIRPQTMETLQQKLDDVSSGATVFLKPAQPSLSQAYVSENDPTHTVNGVAVTSAGAGVSAPSAVAAPAPASKPRPQQPQHAAKDQTPPSKQHAKQQQQQAQQPQKAAKQAHHHPQSPPIAEEETSIDLQGKCQFCGLEDPSFTEEKLDLHYWAECPILISCKSCEQVIEIPTLNDHLLHECEVTGMFRECPTCLEPIATSNYMTHVERGECQPPPDGMQRCALCQTDIERSDEGWKNHLLIETCPKNTRAVKR